MTDLNLHLMVPEIALVALGILILLADLWMKKENRHQLGWWAAIGILVITVYAYFLGPKAGETPRTLMEIDYLLMVDDEARLGALRFAREEGGPFLAEHEAARIPPLIDLHRLLSAAEHVVGDTDTDEDLRLLLAPGSSLGGARPKASVRDRDGHLAIAKFPHKDDEINTVLWEALALRLAAKAGIPVPDWRIEHVANIARRKGYRTIVFGNTVYGLRGRFAKLGHWIFHVSFLVILAQKECCAQDNSHKQYNND